MCVCVNSKRRREEWISRRLDVGKEVPDEAEIICMRKRISKQITNIRSKCTNEQTAWIPLWCIL